MPQRGKLWAGDLPADCGGENIGFSVPFKAVLDVKNAIGLSLRRVKMWILNNLGKWDIVEIRKAWYIIDGTFCQSARIFENQKIGIYNTKKGAAQYGGNRQGSP